jgi:FlaA1/EpsC-like NDP-sugar epimerase
MGRGGDVFVLDMGEPIRILDLAKRMIHLSGLEIKDETHPNGEIEISYTGLRPGEKLFEELLIGNEISETAHCRIMRAEEEIIPLPDLFQSLGELKLAVKQDNLKLMRDILQQAVSGFNPQCELNDLLLKEEEKEASKSFKTKKNPLMLVSKNRQRKTN